MKQSIKIVSLLALIAIAIFSLPGVAAELKLDDIQFDPAIIASGDEVDIVIQFHDEGTPLDEAKINDERYTFEIKLEPDDDLTNEYVLIQDSQGDNLRGRITSGAYYNKVFRIKVLNNAPAGNYEFKLSGRWYKDGNPLESTRYMRFLMPVKKEGIVLDITTIDTEPTDVRPGDKAVEVTARIENSGEKDAKAVEVQLTLPEGLGPAFTNNNRIWVGRVNAGESKEMVFFVDVNDTLPEGIRELSYEFKYSDLDNNNYEKTTKLPFYIRARPYLEVTKTEGEGYAGATTKLFVTVKNLGEQSAEAVDVRILKQSSQPFTLDERSDYIGELKPGEEGVAIFDININRDAEFKAHNLKLLIRAKGDSDEGDETIYTFNRRATLQVTGKAPNKLGVIGLALAGVVLIIIVGNIIYRRKRK